MIRGFFMIIIATSLFVALTACGKRGALYLPPADQQGAHQQGEVQT